MWFLQAKNGLCASNGWFCSEKHKKTKFSWYLWRHKSKWRHFTVFNITPLDSSLKFLWVRCDFYKPRMIYARQTDDFVVKNVKNTIFVMSKLKMTLFYDFQNNSIGFFVEIPMTYMWFYKPRIVYARQTDEFVVKNAKTPFSRHLWRHNSKWRHFMIFNITPLDSSLKFLWVRCDFHKPRMVYARQTDDFVVKNVKKYNILDIYDVIT